MSSFPVTEIFESLQGEGNRTGRKALFIRFHFCNLTCSWCDSKFTWLSKSGPHESWGAEKLRERIRAFKGRDVILTGGEPALQSLDTLHMEDFDFHVESNGTIIPGEDLDLTLADGTKISRPAMDEKIFRKFNWVISPKLATSRQKPEPRALRYWSEKPFAVFKFVLTDPDSGLKEIQMAVDEYGIPKHRTYVGIEGTTRESQLRPDWVEKILEAGFHFSPRLHVLLWGNERAR
ncbi:MAG: 7-carboxy-7-deazaguanine synthase QueE [Spirochaetia bacterium]|nr:7-carboxy-7-deazaguanine synthase QueE [Spirochaetia bacterium]